MKNISKILFSYVTTLILFAILAIGAGVATIIENDFGTETADTLIYNHIWYEIIMVLMVVNLIGIIYKTNMVKNKAKFIFHSSFVIILIGAGITRYYGYEGFMSIREGQTTNEVLSMEPYLQIDFKNKNNEKHIDLLQNMGAIGNNDIDLKLEFLKEEYFIKLVSFKMAKQGKMTMGIMELEVGNEEKKETIKIVGKGAQKTGITKTVSFNNGTEITLEYGSKIDKLPFSLKLIDFELKRYAGSNTPSSYSSLVEIIDNDIKEEDKEYKIYMNHILNYKGYKFFQSSNDEDEKGTVLSVNKDPGYIPTYIGYFLLALGLILNIFDKKSRLRTLIKKVSKSNVGVFVLFSTLFLINQTPIQAKEVNEKVQYLKEYKQNTKEIASVFSKVILQKANGRMLPIDSFSKELLYKLAKKKTLLGMDSNQIFLGMLVNPNIWKDIKIVKIKHPKLKKYLNVEKERKYISFSEVFTKNGYKIKSIVEDAYKVNPKDRGTFEKAVLRLDEKMNIIYNVLNSNILKVIPTTQNNNTWYSPLEAMKVFNGEERTKVIMIINNIFNNLMFKKYDEAKQGIKVLSTFQKEVGINVIPSDNKVKVELLYNKMDIFVKETYFYLIIGLILLILAFMNVIKEKESVNKIYKVLLFTIIIAFVIQTLGMVLRWYISGHAPWSNAYESLIYIAWSIMFAGVVFFRKSMFVIASATLMTSIFLLTAHLNEIDPEITNLVPVLKSYWLTIHVSIITGSYGFLGLSAMIGFITLLLFIIKNTSKENITQNIKQLTNINEISIIIGLTMLVIGNFLGGVWANESWGRYWGWDSKETWAYVSILVYAMVSHMRLIKPLKSEYIFSLTSVWAFSSILMTYFGVNFYLSGMHSYATGDPVPIPMWVYITTTVVLLISIVAFKNRKLN